VAEAHVSGETQKYQVTVTRLNRTTPCFASLYTALTQAVLSWRDDLTLQVRGADGKVFTLTTLNLLIDQTRIREYRSR
jgi:hypothetical protein